MPWQAWFASILFTICYRILFLGMDLATHVSGKLEMGLMVFGVIAHIGLL